MLEQHLMPDSPSVMTIFSNRVLLIPNRGLSPPNDLFFINFIFAYLLFSDAKVQKACHRQVKRITDKSTTIAVWCSETVTGGERDGYVFWVYCQISRQIICFQMYFPCIIHHIQAIDRILLRCRWWRAMNAEINAVSHFAGIEQFRLGTQYLIAVFVVRSTLS